MRSVRSLLPRRQGLRLAAPGHPDVALVDHIFEPAPLLRLAGTAVQKTHGIDMALPAACHRQVRLSDLRRHHPKGMNVVAERAEAQTAMRLRNRRREQPCIEQVCKVLCRELRRSIVFVRPFGKPLA